MSSSTLKLLALVMAVLALLSGFIAYRMTADATRGAQAGAAVQGQTMAVVSVRNISAYTAIGPDVVALVPVAVLPDDHFTKVEDVIGRAPLTDVPIGTTLSGRVFREANTLVRSIPPGFHAMSLEINDVIAVGGFVRPGDRVDVLLYIRASGREVEDSQARVLLRDARVLAYEDRILNDAEPTGGEEAEPRRQPQRRVRTAVLAVPEGDTTRVMLGASLGQLRLALRNSTDEETFGVLGEDGMPVETVGTLAPESGDENVVTLRELAAFSRGSRQSTPDDTGGSEGVVVYRGSQAQQSGR